MTPEDLHLAVTARLTAQRQRYTRTRRALVEVLGTSDFPLTITDVLDRGEELAMSTAYRNLSILEHCGVVARVAPLQGEEARFELAEPLLAHHHLLCTRCGHVQDLTVPDHIEDALHTLTSRAARLTGFAITAHRLDFLGLCRRCP